MKTLASILKRQFWPISAIVFGPWHASLCLWAISRLAAGTALESYMAAHDSTPRPLVVVLFSLYFMFAFMMWVAGKRTLPRHAEPQPALGLSSMQILLWSLIGILAIPVVAWISTAGYWAHVAETFHQIFGRDPSANLGFVWLISIAMLIMTPTMVVWLVWMWRAWSQTDPSQMGTEPWDYEYEA